MLIGDRTCFSHIRVGPSKCKFNIAPAQKFVHRDLEIYTSLYHDYCMAANGSKFVTEDFLRMENLLRPLNVRIPVEGSY